MFNESQLYNNAIAFRNTNKWQKVISNKSKCKIRILLFSMKSTTKSTFIQLKVYEQDRYWTIYKTILIIEYGKFYLLFVDKKLAITRKSKYRMRFWVLLCFFCKNKPNSKMNIHPINRLWIRPLLNEISNFNYIIWIDKKNLQ